MGEFAGKPARPGESTMAARKTINTLRMEWFDSFDPPNPTPAAAQLQPQAGAACSLGDVHRNLATESHRYGTVPAALRRNYLYADSA